MNQKIIDAIFGLAIGDAVGVPYEFTQPHIMKEHPAVEMVGGGSHRQPRGTWSDDTTLALILMDGLAESYDTPDYNRIMEKSLAWLDHAEYTATDVVFDVGKTCLRSIAKYAKGCEPLACGQRGEYDCGNGALMRCLPLLFWLEKFYGPDFVRVEEARTVIHNIAALTHGHPRCQVANGLYLSIAAELLKGKDKFAAVHDGLYTAKEEYELESVFSEELPYYKRLFLDEFANTPDEEISSRAYVVSTLETAIWALLGTDDYRSCILKAVNLGHDTDTTAAIAGGLAGLLYGYENIPESWKEGLLKADYIRTLCEKYSDSLS